MRRSAPMPAAFLALLLVLSLASRAGAQTFLDVYAGYSLTRDSDIDTRLDGTSQTFHDVEFDESFAVGGRVGHWFKLVPFLGLALDVSYFRPDIGAQGVGTSTGGQVELGRTDLHVIGVGAQALVRLPLPIVKPYVFAGPAVFVTVANASGEAFGVPGDHTGADASIGLKAGAGVRFVLFGSFGVFAEYQFTRFSPEFEFRSGGVRNRVETDIETHHAVVGATIQF